MAAKLKRLTLADLKREVGKHGGTVEGGVIGQHADYNIDAPEGKRWSCSGTHALVTNWHANEDGSPTWPAEKQDALSDAIQRVGHGTEDCDDLDCDICHPED